MKFPRLPDWLVYVAILMALTAAAISRRERADAPAPPPPMAGEATTPLSPLSPFNAAKIVKIPADGGGHFATAFSAGEEGVWLTTAAVTRDCAQLAVVIAPGRGVEAKARTIAGGRLAILTTDGGSPPLPLAESSAKPGEDSFIPGFPQGAPGEAAVRLIGPDPLDDHKRGERPGLAWTEIGRTDGLKGLLDGVEGAPVLDGMGHVEGVALGQAPRRGRIHAVPVEAVRAALAKIKPAPPATPSDNDVITTDNYGRAADALRRDLRVVQVWCRRV
jgi:hypothetical protein